jgi:predicted transcriptional regulator
VANLTLSIDDDVLQRAREIAVGERTSVNAVVRDFLTRYVDARSRRLAALDALDAVAASVSSSSAPGWTREELHERSG